MSSTQVSPGPIALPETPATHDRVEHCLRLRQRTAEQDALIPAPVPLTNGDEQRYSDKCGTYSKGIQQNSVGLVNLAAFQTFRDALDNGHPDAFNNIITGGGKGLNGPQGGLAFPLDCLDNSQYLVKAAPALASDLYATELVELYWASLLRDVAFTDYGTNTTAQNAAAELSHLPAYQGPKVSGQVTTDVLFRGGFVGETSGPYLSQFLLQPTSLGTLPIMQQYTSNASGVNFMTDASSFELAQNGLPTGFSLSPAPAQYLHNGRGLTAYTHADVLYQAYFITYLCLSSLKIPTNPGNPYNGLTTQNGFGTFGDPDFASTLAAVASEALKAVWYQKWFVHLRHRPESGGAIVYLTNTAGTSKVEGHLSGTILNSQALQTSRAVNNSWFLSQAFPEGSPNHPAYPTGHGTVAGACITVLKFFFDGNATIPNPKVPLNDGSGLANYVGALSVNGELNKLAHNVSFGHGIHAGIHWRSDTDTSIQLGEAVALSFLQDRAHTYNEKFTVEIQKVDGTPHTISNE